MMNKDLQAAIHQKKLALFESPNKKKQTFISILKKENDENDHFSPEHMPENRAPDHTQSTFMPYQRRNTEAADHEFVV